MGVLGLREQEALDPEHPDRDSTQFAQLGQAKAAPRKLRAAIPEAFKHLVPADQIWSSVAIFEAILRGKFMPLYSLDGKPQCPTVVDDDNDVDMEEPVEPTCQPCI